MLIWLCSAATLVVALGLEWINFIYMFPMSAVLNNVEAIMDFISFPAVVLERSDDDRLPPDKLRNGI